MVGADTWSCGWSANPEVLWGRHGVWEPFDLRESLRPRLAWIQEVWLVLPVARHVKIGGSGILARAELVLHAFGPLKDKTRNSRLERRGALVILQEEEVVWCTTLQSEGAKRFLIFILSSCWPMEPEVGLELRIEGACGHRLEEAARGLALYLDGLTLHLLGRVLLLHE